MLAITSFRMLPEVSPKSVQRIFYVYLPVYRSVDWQVSMRIGSKVLAHLLSISLRASILNRGMV